MTAHAMLDELAGGRARVFLDSGSHVELGTQLLGAEGDAAVHAALAPAGGVTLANALDYARAGADLLVTAAPYFAPPADVKVTIEPA